MDHMYDALRYGMMTRPRSSIWDYNPVNQRTGFQIADPNIWILNMAEDNEIPFDTAEVTVMEDNDPAIRSESDVVSYVQGRFKRAEDVRQQDEQRWLKAYRNYRGLYGPDVQFTETEKSRVFVKVTKTKTLAAYGQIIDVLFGNNNFPLTVNPTKLPDGVAESVHINIDPNAEKGQDELRQAFEDKPSEPFLHQSLTES